MSTATITREPGIGTAPAPTRPARRLRLPGLDTVFSAVFVVFGFGVGIERLSDNSFFTHLLTGRWILDHGIPRHDVYSFTAPGTRFVAQSWLAEVMYASLERMFGPFGIRLLGAVTGALITVLVFRLALRLARDRVRAALLAVAALAGLYVLWSERPLLLGVLCFVVLLWIVEVPDCRIGRHPYIALPLLFWFWANVHGTFALGLAYLGLHLVGRWLDGAPPWQDRERRLLVGSVIAFGATFLNPYGATLVVFPLNLMKRGDILRHVVEWASPNFHDLRGQAFLLWIAVFVAVVARARNRVSRRDLLVTLPFLLLGFWALRNVAIAPIVGLPVATRAVAVDRDVAEQRRRTEVPSPLAAVLLAVLVFAGLVLLAWAWTQPDFATTAYPVKAMSALEHRGLIGKRLLMDDGDAAYAELAYFPKQKIFMDDRYDMFPTSVIYDYLGLAKGGLHWQRVFHQYDVETVVWGKRDPLVHDLLQSGNWTEIHRDATWVALVRNDVHG